VHLTYRRRIPTEDLIGRLLGPDTVGAYVQVIAVEQSDPDTSETWTVATCRPVPAAELATMTRDEFGQWWLPLPEAVTTGA
jgi:hypothetical protein